MHLLTSFVVSFEHHGVGSADQAGVSRGDGAQAARIDRTRQ